MSRLLLFIAGIALWSLAANSAGFAASCTSSGSSGGATVWIGMMQVYKQSDACPQQFFTPSDTARSLYRPYLSSGDRPSAFTHFLANNHAMLITNRNATAQFSGNGQYQNCGIDDTADFAGPVNGSYSFTQTPATIAADTDFVTLDGHISNYGNYSGCSLYFRGVYVRKPAQP